MDENTCLICEKLTKFESTNYSSYVCECGQKYEWDESLKIVLTPEQIGWLKKMPKEEPNG
jgi:hypothetical protein